MAAKRSLVRGGITLAVLAAVAGAMVVAPAGAHVTGKFGHLKKHINQIAKKQANQVFDSKIGGASVANAANADKLDNLDSADFVKKSESFNRNWSCAGTDWDEYEDSDAILADGGSGRYSTNNAIVRCSVSIPDGATVTATHFAVRDASAETITCEMWRTNTATAVGGETFMAAVSTTGTPGNVRITDTTITQPTIDNASFAYFVQCFLGTTTDIRIFGGNVAYTVTGAQGAGRVAAAAASDAGISGDA